ncbi:unnamed protein product [Moneuplotes crassus]|uniref:Spermatogenesis-associated protein 17 n=1 Tax=Euplotes crassus TaxID=5936 RepID=A0A7S3NSL0_EUPCR|nr:unnamed protein product [Moneuplotes crassus]|mmetsp:Transcript_16837/g.16502  ORF Transcript_16837/g.16502 Transcript_16837/m.16502 type:complete len:231 (+) Transcript_16837:2-694(+)
MASFLAKINAEKQDVVTNYYENLSKAEDNREKEKKAAISIQTTFRMYLILTLFKTTKRAVRNIERIWKGFKVRRLFLKLMREEKRRMQMVFFNAMATIIQKIFRGYYVRKYKHDFYARKTYLSKVVLKNEEVRDKLEEFRRTSEEEEEKRKEEIARLELTKVASNVHHLCSTKAIPGVFNSPYVSNEMKPQIFNVGVETHLKTTFKSNYKWKAPNKKKINYFKQTLTNHY